MIPRHGPIILLLLLVSGVTAGQTVYVSSSRGDDSSDGASASAPVKTIRRARELGNDIRLREGDVFFEYLRGRGFSLSAYADEGTAGQKPVISGFRVIPSGLSARLWERGSLDGGQDWKPDPEGDIYRLDLLADGFRGFTLNVSENDKKNIHNVGAIYDAASDKIFGRKCQCPDSVSFAGLSGDGTSSPYRYLDRDLDFWQPRGSYRYIYVKASDPGLLLGRELSLSMGADAVRGNDFSVSGIKFTGWGKHGVRGGSDIRVTGCDFDIIGGSLHEYEPYWVRYGNGAEFWADSACRDEVARCTFSRIFDTATTIQGPMTAGSQCSDIHIHDNIIRGCRQDFEVWIRSEDGNMPSDCSFKRNEGYDCGQNGFETQEFNNTHVLHYVLSPFKITGITVEDNVFHDGMGLFYANSKMDNFPVGHNIYICKPGAPVIHGLYGTLDINAPVRKGLRYFFAEGLAPEGGLTFGHALTRRRALRRFNNFINSLTAGSSWEVRLEREKKIKKVLDY